LNRLSLAAVEAIGCLYIIMKQDDRAFEEASLPTQPPRLVSRLDETCGNHLKIRNLRH
jgi:hypothetical protein